MLLQEHHRALGGPQQQHGVDGGDVEAFVEQVDREEDLELAGLQAAQGLGAITLGINRRQPYQSLSRLNETKPQVSRNADDSAWRLDILKPVTRAFW